MSGFEDGFMGDNVIDHHPPTRCGERVFTEQKSGTMQGEQSMRDKKKYLYITSDEGSLIMGELDEEQTWQNVLDEIYGDLETETLTANVERREIGITEMTQDEADALPEVL
jgi:hypothetical protein